jgi:hypothetical protein
MITYQLVSSITSRAVSTQRQMKGRNTALEPETQIVYTLAAHRPLPFANVPWYETLDVFVEMFAREPNYDITTDF